MTYDLAIIGTGFAGLEAIKLARQNKLNFCVIAEEAGGTQHFSGAFDVIDPRWQNPLLSVSGLPSISQALEDFIKAHRDHLYSWLSGAPKGFAKDLNEEILSFFNFYKIPIKSDPDYMVVTFDACGTVKPTGYCMLSQGLRVSEIDPTAEVVYVNFGALPAYPARLIQQNLSSVFSKVSVLDVLGSHMNRTSPHAALLQYYDAQENIDSFVSFLKNKLRGLNNVKYLFIPPVLGVQNHWAHHHQLETQLNVKVVELLSSLPSSAGLRFQEKIDQFFLRENFTHLKGRVVSFETEEKRISKIYIRFRDDTLVEVIANKYVLASGKFVGGGIERKEFFKESAFDLPLFSQGRFIHSKAQMEHLIDANPISIQGFMDLGIRTNDSGMPVFHVGQGAVYPNLRACGHVLTGFDFTRDRCGFGVSIGSAMRAMKD